ncbi:MAG: TCR/Tet family MFS transporter [Bacteroidota bacterium]
MINRTPAVGFIFITMVIDIAGLGMIIPVLPALIGEMTGEGISGAAQWGGWLMFSYSATQFLFAPLLGSLSDRFGRRPILLASLFGFALDYLLMAMAPAISWLFVGRILAGVFGASITTAFAYIADISTPDKKAANFGMVGAAFGIGFIVGPVIGGLLGELGPRMPFYASACLALANALYGYFILPESLPKDKRRRFEWKRSNPLGVLLRLRTNHVVVGMLATVFFYYAASHAVQTNWTYYTIYRFEWSESMVGYSLGLAGLLSGIVQGLLIRVLVPRIGSKSAVFIGLSIYISSFLLFSIATQGWMMFAFLIPYCLAGITSPSVQSIMSNHVAEDAQGELQGGFTGVVSLTSILGPPLMTGLFHFFTSDNSSWHWPAAPFVTASLLSAISLFFAWRTLKGR